MKDIVSIFADGKNFYFGVNDDLTISRSTDQKNWEVIDFRFYIGREQNTLNKIGELSSVSLKVQNGHLIMMTNLGAYVAKGGTEIGDSWHPC